MKLENVKAGDYLIHSSTDPRSPDSIVKVERTTKTLVITTKGGRYRKEDGRPSGEDGWSLHFSSISIPAEGDLDRLAAERRKRRAVATLNAFDWNCLGLLELETVIKAVEEAKEARKND